MAAGIVIRTAQNEADAASASRIYATSWKTAYRGAFSDKLLDDIPLDFWTPHFNANYETGRFTLAILSAEGADAGAGAYGLSRDTDDCTVGEITSLYLLPEAWGEGYAAPLMDSMLDGLRTLGCTKAHLWTLRENRRARRFYEKMGFSLTGAEKELDYKGERVTDLEYARAL